MIRRSDGSRVPPPENFGSINITASDVLERGDAVFMSGHTLHGSNTLTLNTLEEARNNFREWGSVVPDLGMISSDINNQINEQIIVGLTDVAPHSVQFTNKEGKRIKIDFSGNEVKYEGDMIMSDAADLFFNAVFQRYFNHAQARAV
jgi:hypothetical protein